MAKNQGSHQADALGGRSKQVQRRPIPDAVDIPLDADVIKHLREREKANAATSASVAGIGELTPHGDKKDLPPSAPGKTTRVSKESDGSISQPNSNARPQPGKNSSDPCDALGNPQRHRQDQHEFDAKERDVKKLHDAKRKQFGSNGYGGTN
jgi:hypothetical protein